MGVIHTTSAGGWDATEFQLLLELVKTYGNEKWEKVSNKLGTGRSAIECKDKYDTMMQGLKGQGGGGGGAKADAGKKGKGKKSKHQEENDEKENEETNEIAKEHEEDTSSRKKVKKKKTKTKTTKTQNFVFIKQKPFCVFSFFVCL